VVQNIVQCLLHFELRNSSTFWLWTICRCCWWSNVRITQQPAVLNYVVDKVVIPRAPLFGGTRLLATRSFSHPTFSLARTHALVIIWPLKEARKENTSQIFSNSWLEFTRMPSRISQSNMTEDLLRSGERRAKRASFQFLCERDEEWQMEEKKGDEREERGGKGDERKETEKVKLIN